jgi:hypothetical protein
VRFRLIPDVTRTNLLVLTSTKKMTLMFKVVHQS